MITGPESAGGWPVFGYGIYGIWALGYLDMRYGRLVILYIGMYGYSAILANISSTQSLPTRSSSSPLGLRAALQAQGQGVGR